MRFTHLIKKLILSLTVFCAAATVLAQDAAAPAEKTVQSSYNQLEILLLIVMAILAVFIWGLGQVLLSLSRKLMEKSKGAGPILILLLVTSLSLSTQSGMAQGTEAAATVKEIPNYGGISSTSFYLFAAVAAVEIIAILFMIFSIRRIYTELFPEDEKVSQPSAARQWWSSLDKKVLTKAVPLEQEADHLLDHNYDGIQELDNALPPWWKYGFYITIVVAVIYLLNFHVFETGKTPLQEYTAEMDQAKAQKEAFESKNTEKVDENDIKMADEAGLAKAKQIFQSQCWACHGKLGEGGAGPNLTDDYWLHKGSLNDIYHSIKVGYPDKGMQSWATVFNPKEISYLASYVKTLHGTNPPNPKAPQGDLFTEAGAGGAAAAPAAKSDSSTKAK